MAKLEPSEPIPCPIDCPNRRRSGILLFGHVLDPVEFTLQLTLLMVIAFPATKRAWSDNFTWQEAFGWFGVMAAGSGVLRMAPTDRANAYTKIFSK